MQDSFFITQRKRKITPSKAEEAKKRHCHYEDGVLIFDKELAPTAATPSMSSSVEASDIEVVYAASREGLEKKKDNVVATAKWAINLYLEPANVMRATSYWLSQYVNYKLPEAEWFNDHIQGLMMSPVRLSLSSSKGIPHIHARLPKNTLLMHFSGSNLHKIPSEYFVHQDCEQILECLRYFIEPVNECFLTRNTFGLKGELELSTFQYNRILSYFYEPSFFIFTSYLFYIHYLLTLPQGKQLSSFLPRVKNIMKPIEHKRVAWDNLLCLDRANTNYAEKRQIFEQDLIELSQALNHLEVDQVLDQVTALWSKKATYVTDQIDIRYNAICDQLY